MRQGRWSRASAEAHPNEGSKKFGEGASVDRLYGNAGNHSLNGAKGNDYLFGGDGTDTSLAAEADDIVDFVETT